ncbi:Asp-tRNA(Asn)/Glu-tRNA(Gln) amidotransferase subunit GatC [Reichenbachiella agarivorans]|uniref:Aspartyl/glutamyl-tRNA(Asn/Gln) amidotransferase subunit C n=1 Tax=Reichenbachiella agarivorans TaxID=2979464 RepID=A0ABY6CTD1_9BACT|nr:Asp-tRNA(Asn)/Glu-tRNA(Gln) amidotransferase subunit GatC [Reichenbachiella agarivorans]UXP33777.1 Asp-tRNA(Asn)/Glu-tRNA(Gln) amidotransferase subunit GatC [Reichenbachiella agarivorans]
MAVEINTVKKLANLAKLDLTHDQELKMSKDLGDILDWVEQLSEVETSDVLPLGNVNEDSVPLRRDVASNYFSEKEALLNAPKSDDAYFIVPKVLS